MASEGIDHGYLKHPVTVDCRQPRASRVGTQRELTPVRAKLPHTHLACTRHRYQAFNIHSVC